MNTRHVNHDGNTLELKKFDVSKMVKGYTAAMIAKRGTGKSFLIKDIMFKKKNTAAAIAISKTEHMNSFYKDFIPDTYIYSEYKPEILGEIFKRQKLINEDNERRAKEGKKPKDSSLTLIMDDCMSDNKIWLKDRQIGELFFNGRHYNISFILTMQYLLGIPPNMRGNLDYIFLLGEDSKITREKIYKQYANMFDTYDLFEQTFEKCTENYGVMVINNRIHSTNIPDKVFWYCAKEPPKFRVGSNKFYKFHSQHYNSEWNKLDETFKPVIPKKKQFVKINVEKIKH